MISILIYTVLCFGLLYSFAKLSYKFNYIDIPDQRKFHSEPTAYTGGIAISIILLFALQFFNIFDVIDRKINLIISIGLLISIVGLIDDKYKLNVGTKLSLQILPIFYLITFENFILNHIGDYNFFELNLKVFSLPFTLIGVLFLTNAFNYFDGLDGTLVFSTISVFAILYFLLIDQNFKYFFIMILIPLSIFLLFNFSVFKLPKLFLGDSGSLFIGFIVAFFLIFVASLNIIHPILLAWSIVIFVYEFLSINLIRLKYNKNPFEAGRDHLHHLLFNFNKSLFLTNLIISTLNIFLFILGYLSFKLMNSFYSLVLYIMLFTLFFYLRNFFLKKIMSKNF